VAGWCIQFGLSSPAWPETWNQNLWFHDLALVIGRTANKIHLNDLLKEGGEMGRSMTAADIYRRYASECMKMSHQPHRGDHDKAVLVEMAAMWLRLAEFADKHGDTDSSAPAG